MSPNATNVSLSPLPFSSSVLDIPESEIRQEHFQPPPPNVGEHPAPKKVAVDGALVGGIIAAVGVVMTTIAVTVIYWQKRKKGRINAEREVPTNIIDAEWEVPTSIVKAEWEARGGTIKDGKGEANEEAPRNKERDHIERYETPQKVSRTRRRTTPKKPGEEPRRQGGRRMKREDEV